MRLPFKGSKHRCGTKARTKLDVALKSVDIQRQLENKMDDVIKEQTETTLNVDETWTKLRNTVYQGALDVLGTTKRKHRDRFDENDAEAATILRKMHESHLQWINDRESAAKAPWNISSVYNLENTHAHLAESAFSTPRSCVP